MPHQSITQEKYSTAVSGLIRWWKILSNFKITSYFGCKIHAVKLAQLFYLSFKPCGIQNSILVTVSLQSRNAAGCGCRLLLKSVGCFRTCPLPWFRNAFSNGGEIEWSHPQEANTWAPVIMVSPTSIVSLGTFSSIPWCKWDKKKNNILNPIKTS